MPDNTRNTQNTRLISVRVPHDLLAKIPADVPLSTFIVEAIRQLEHGSGYPILDGQIREDGEQNAGQ